MNKTPYLFCNRLDSSGCSRAGTRQVRQGTVLRVVKSAVSRSIQVPYVSCGVGKGSRTGLVAQGPSSRPCLLSYCPLPPLLPESWPAWAPLIGLGMRVSSWRGSSCNFTRPSRALFRLGLWISPTSHFPPPCSASRAVSVFLQKHHAVPTPSTLRPLPPMCAPLADVSHAAQRCASRRRHAQLISPSYGAQAESSVLHELA